MIAEAMWIVIGLAFVFVVGYVIGCERTESRLRREKDDKKAA